MVLINFGGGVFSLSVLPSQLLGTGGSLYFTTNNLHGHTLHFVPTAGTLDSVYTRSSWEFAVCRGSERDSAVHYGPFPAPTVDSWRATVKLPVNYATPASGRAAASSSPGIRCRGVAPGGPEYSLHPPFSIRSN